MRSCDDTLSLGKCRVLSSFLLISGRSGVAFLCLRWISPMDRRAYAYRRDSAGCVRDYDSAPSLSDVLAGAALAIASIVVARYISRLKAAAPTKGIKYYRRFPI